MTYPNILILDYLKKLNKTTPEIKLKAENYINLGYQRLLTFEARSGGFSWFGEEPANLVLSAYGLMELAEMADVYPIDTQIIGRTKAWLLRQQNADGSWGNGDQRRTWSAVELERDKLRLTAYVAWALVVAGQRGPEIARAVDFLTKNFNGRMDPYTLALAANLMVGYDKNHPMTAKVFAAIIDARTEEAGHAYWKQTSATPTFGDGDDGTVEATALVAQGLLKWQGGAGLANAALKYLISKKDKNGFWFSTQATIQALKALNLSVQGGSDAEGTIELSVDDTPVQTLAVNKDNSDLLHQFDLQDRTRSGLNRVALKFRGKGALLYQIVGRYYLLWSSEPLTKQEPLSIEVKYDKSRLKVNDMVQVKVNVRNKTEKVLNMVILDLGVPPGFDSMAADFEKMVAEERLQKYSVQGPQIILYLDNLGSYEEKEFSYWLRAKYPLKVTTPTSRAYEYYNPQNESFAKLEALQVVN